MPIMGALAAVALMIDMRELMSVSLNHNLVPLALLPQTVRTTTTA